MKKYLLLLMIFITCLPACKQKPQKKDSEESPSDTLAAAQENPKIFNCKEDSLVKYLLYLPEKPKAKTPLLLFFDPSGNAGIPVIKYKEIADKMGVAIAGSMNSRNGQTVGQSVYFGKTIIKDIIKNNNIDSNRIFVAGFSGGARVATRLAEMNPEIKAVIGNSAGFENTSGYFPSFGFVGIGGSADMNMLELVNLHKYLRGSKTPHMLLMFDGIHEWAPKNDMAKAMLWLLCLTKSESAATLLQEMEVSSRALADSLEKQGDLLKAATEWETLIGCSHFLGKENIVAKENYMRIQKLPAFPKIQNEMSVIWNRETSEQTRLMAGFGKWTYEKWSVETEQLKKTALEKNQNGFLHKRLLGFLSLSCLSYSNRGLAMNDTSMSGYYSGLYTIVDRENPEAWYVRALHYARCKNAEGARSAISMAQTKGFIDQARIASQPELVQILNTE